MNNLKARLDKLAKATADAAEPKVIALPRDPADPRPPGRYRTSDWTVIELYDEPEDARDEP